MHSSQDCQKTWGSLLYKEGSWISWLATWRSTSRAWIILHKARPEGSIHHSLSSLERTNTPVMLTDNGGCRIKQLNHLATIIAKADDKSYLHAKTPGLKVRMIFIWMGCIIMNKSANEGYNLLQDRPI